MLLTNECCPLWYSSFVLVMGISSLQFTTIVLAFSCDVVAIWSKEGYERFVDMEVLMMSHTSVFYGLFNISTCAHLIG